MLELRAADRSVVEIAQAVTAEGRPVSHATVWQVLKTEGLERLGARPAAARGAAPPRSPSVKAKALQTWPAGARYESDHAGLFLLLPALVELGFADAVAHAGYPATRVLSAWHSMGSLLACKLARRGRIHHVNDLVADPAVGLAVGLNVLPKTTHLSGYSHRVRREANQALLSRLAGRLVELGITPPAAKGSTSTSTPSATTATNRRWSATTCRNGHNRPPACCRSSPRTTPPKRWSTPTPT